jgi:hypothetical protein
MLDTVCSILDIRYALRGRREEGGGRREDGRQRTEDRIDEIKVKLCPQIL